MINGAKLSYIEINSPVGKLRVIATDEAIVELQFETLSTTKNRLRDVKATPVKNEHHSVLIAAEKQLREYFAGQRTEFDLPLSPHGTEFQQKVWDTLRRIPYGKTRTYGEIARQIGQPNASRAVGGANNRNPIAIIIPCHRVIGRSGDLTGFGGGLEAKDKLLKLEAAQPNP